MDTMNPSNAGRAQLELIQMFCRAAQARVEGEAPKEQQFEDFKSAVIFVYALGVLSKFSVSEIMRGCSSSPSTLNNWLARFATSDNRTMPHTAKRSALLRGLIEKATETLDSLPDED